eukprot:scaffold228375_cov17-Prasinocladus_malaysianus.AAC.1
MYAKLGTVQLGNQQDKPRPSWPGEGLGESPLLRFAIVEHRRHHTAAPSRISRLSMVRLDNTAG